MSIVPFAVRVRLRDTQTGETREFECKYDHIGCGPDNARYIWTEGNYSCDCNRSLSFGVSFEDARCGDGRYELDRLETLGGTNLLEE